MQPSESINVANMAASDEFTNSVTYAYLLSAKSWTLHFLESFLYLLELLSSLNISVGSCKLDSSSCFCFFFHSIMLLVLVVR